jgi:1,4-alpha-glucan branching enzyme
VRSFIRDSIFYWLDRVQPATALRWDSTCNIRNTSNGVRETDIPDGWSLLQWVNNDINSLNPGKIIIAEDLQNNDYLTQDHGRGRRGLRQPVGRAIRAPDPRRAHHDKRRGSQHDGGARCDHTLLQRRAHAPGHLHGKPRRGGQRRVASARGDLAGQRGQLGFARKRSTLGACLVMTSPGIPMIFEGQEFLESGYFADSDPLDWSKDTTYAKIKLLYTDLIRLRKNGNNNTKGLTAKRAERFPCERQRQGDRVPAVV